LTKTKLPRNGLLQSSSKSKIDVLTNQVANAFYAMKRNRQSSCGNTIRMPQLRKGFYQFPHLFFGNSEFVKALQVEPECGACTEEMRQPQRSVSSDRTPSVQDAFRPF
jgi:hypothetical protein